MLKSILNLKGAQQLDKREQKAIQGGFVGDDCLELPPECEPFGRLFNCACIPD